MTALILLAAGLADAVLGDPPRWPHLVRLMGRAVAAGEAWLRPLARSAGGLRLAGGVLVLLVVGGFWLGGWLALKLAADLWPPLAWALALLLSFQCLAAGQLWQEANRVLIPLQQGDLQEARQRLAGLVGRDTDRLGPAGVARALVETVAENLNDGVIAPLFYLALGGPPLAMAYKAVNTLDSMVGYLNQRYRHFGRTAARLDDLAGWLPARLCALLMVAVCPLLGLSAGRAWQALRRDAAKHHSPNAGWPEAAAAGALGVRLGGPASYGGQTQDKPWLNPAGRNPNPADVAACLRLLVLVNFWALLLAASALWAWAGLFT